MSFWEIVAASALGFLAAKSAYNLILTALFEIFIPPRIKRAYKNNKASLSELDTLVKGNNTPTLSEMLDDEPGEFLPDITEEEFQEQHVHKDWGTFRKKVQTSVQKQVADALDRSEE